MQSARDAFPGPFLAIVSIPLLGRMAHTMSKLTPIVASFYSSFDLGKEQDRLRTSRTTTTIPCGDYYIGSITYFQTVRASRGRPSFSFPFENYHFPYYSPHYRITSRWKSGPAGFIHIRAGQPLTAAFVSPAYKMFVTKVHFVVSVLTTLALQNPNYLLGPLGLLSEVQEHRVGGGQKVVFRCSIACESLVKVKQPLLTQAKNNKRKRATRQQKQKNDIYIYIYRLYRRVLIDLEY